MADKCLVAPIFVCLLDICEFSLIFLMLLGGGRAGQAAGAAEPQGKSMEIHGNPINKRKSDQRGICPPWMFVLRLLRAYWSDVSKKKPKLSPVSVIMYSPLCLALC